MSPISVAEDLHPEITVERAEVRDLPTPVLALVPHADDETLGCGGLLAGLFADRAEVHVVLVTDGAASHPNSGTHDAAQRRDVREGELRAALAALGGADARITFWRKPDGQLPDMNPADRRTAVDEFRGWLVAGSYGTVLAPWRRDPHGDHVATTDWLRAALESTGPGDQQPPMVLEYRVWTGHQGDPGAHPTPDDGVRGLAFDVAGFRPQLRHALAAHASQSSDVFDDPDGFTIPPGLAATVERDREVYLTEARPTSTLDGGYFARIYRDADDPWGFASSDYERRKYDDTLGMLPRRRYRRGFEPGCSIGVLTERLARRCGELLATEIDPRARGAAHRRCESLAGVVVSDLFFPRDSPPGTYDLVVLSEVAYYWAPDAFARAADLLVGGLLEPGGHLLLAHYTPTLTDYPLTGDEVHERYRARAGGQGATLRHLGGARRERYRLDVFERR